MFWNQIHKFLIHFMAFVAIVGFLASFSRTRRQTSSSPDTPPHEPPSQPTQFHRNSPSDELQRILEDHKKWVESGGEEGRRATLETANLKGVSLRKATLMGADLRRANLEDADLWGAKLQGACLDSAKLMGANANLVNFKGASLVEVDLSNSSLLKATLQNANLQDAILETATGLLSSQFAGANVSGTKLPEDIKKFEGLTQVEKISQRAQKLFLSILLGCVYCWLTIATTTDLGLLTNSSSSPLPIIQTKIPIAGFYWTAPLILLSLYVWFHLYLQRLWEGLAELPVVFPDGKRLDQKIYPWLVNGIVSSHVRALKRNRPPLSKLQTGISTFLAWWLVPITFAFFWLRYLPKHHWAGTLEHIALIVFTCWFAAWSQTLARKTLEGQEQVRFVFKNSWKSLVFLKFIFKRSLAFTSLFLVIPLLAGIISDGAINGVIPPQEEVTDMDLRVTREKLVRTGRFESPGCGTKILGKLNSSQLIPLRTWYQESIPEFLVSIPLIGAHAFADLTEQEVSTRPANWFILRDEDAKNLENVVTGASLQGANLRCVSARGAFLVNADLREADLSGANLVRANIQKGKLDMAILNNADLRAAQLQDANLRFADLRGADLRYAQLQGVNVEFTMLSGANLLHANLLQAKHFWGGGIEMGRNWVLAFYSPDLLEIFGLPMEHNQNIKQKNFENYDLSSKDLQSANFRQFSFRKARLNEANLSNARMGGADLREANLFKANLENTFFGSFGGVDTNLTGANLLEARNLMQAQLDFACSDGGTQLDPGFKSPPPCKKEKEE